MSPPTRTRRRILLAAEKARLGVQELRWDPIGPSIEMCGPVGGWSLELDSDTLHRRFEATAMCDSYLCAYNATDLIGQIERLGVELARIVTP